MRPLRSVCSRRRRGADQDAPGQEVGGRQAFAAETLGVSRARLWGLLGGLTIVGWVVTLLVGPIAAVHLWRFRESGRRAGIILFGFGLVYDVVGLLALRAPEASIAQIVATATMFAVPLLVLLSRRARPFFAACS